MATRMKTVEYWFPLYTATAADLTEVTLTQITLYLPESSKTFRKVTAHAVYHDLNTTLTGNIDRVQLSLQVGSAGYSAVNNTTANQVGSGGENWTLSFSGDYTAYFTTNWSGTSMTCDCKFLADNDLGTSPTALGFNNISVVLRITYDYDDTSATHVKTVWIPLDMPVGALATTKPGTAVATIPQLTGSGSPLLVENSPTIRQSTVVVQGNTSANAATDRTYSVEIGTGGSFTTGSYKHGSTVDMFIRFNHVTTWTTTASASWYVWSSLASLHHGQAYLVVTYEFTLSGTTALLNSLWLPLSGDAPLGGTTSSDYQRWFAELWIEEPTTITTKHLAAYVFCSQLAAIGGLNYRLGTGSFVAYTDNATVTAGTNAAMIRNDGAFSLARGRNLLTVDSYRTDTTDLGWGTTGFLIVNYTSGVPSGGPGAANHTVFWAIYVQGTGAGGGNLVAAATAPTIPETAYFCATGLYVEHLMATTAFPWVHYQVERLASGGEGGIAWEPFLHQGMQGDPEPGNYVFAVADPGVFKQWPSDPVPTRLGLPRLDVETARRWRFVSYNTALLTVFLTLTYHAVTFTVSGTVSGYVDADGAGLTVEIWRADGIKVAEVTTTTGGAYTATVYDSTLAHWATCREDATHVGRSDNVTPS